MSSNERSGEYTPTGEQDGTAATFSAEEIASAFGIESSRVTEAMTGEYGSSDQPVDSRQAQQLAEVLLADLPQSERMAALVKLGAYTPRADHVEGLGEKDPAEESDKFSDLSSEREESD